MRSLKELLELFLDEENQKFFEFGICHWARRLFKNKKMTYDEYHHILDFINTTKVSKFSSIDAFLAPDFYYWRPGKLKPRLKWIKKQIKMM